jgi:DNA-binding CsgD family transcriptional regulator
VAAAEALCQRLEADSQAVQSRFGDAAARRSRGFIALARGNDDSAADCFTDSVARFAAIGVPLERARVELALGSLLRRRGQRRKAREVLDAARVTFTDCGAVDCASAATAELAAISGRAPHGADVLTASEQRIVDLVATGLGNRAVARQLHLSVKTVEAHLNRAFRKLGVSNRTEMSSRLASRNPDT